MLNRISTMVAASRANREENERGFTLIELLVVVLIIGILSAIAIPVFLGQQDQARDAAAKSDLTNAKVAMISAATASTDGTYPGPGDENLLTDFGYTESQGITVPVSIVTGTATFCLQATSGAGNIFHITSTSGVLPDACP